MTFTAHLRDRVNKISEHVRSKTKVPVQYQVLQLGPKTLKPQRTLSSYGIDKETTIHLTLKVVRPSDEVLPLVLVEPGDEGAEARAPGAKVHPSDPGEGDDQDEDRYTPKKQIVNCNGKKLEDGEDHGRLWHPKRAHSLFMTCTLVGDHPADGVIAEKKELISVYFLLTNHTL